MLRAPEPSDLEKMYEWENDPDRLLHGRTGLPYSKAFLSDYITTYNETALSSGHVRFIVSDHKMLPLGILDLYDIDLTSRKAFISVYIDSNYRNRGIAKSAVTEAICFARDQLGMNQLIAIVNEENQISLSLFKKVGFTHIALLPQWVRAMDGSLKSASLLAKYLR